MRCFLHVLFPAGRAVARTGETVRLSGASVPQTWESEVYRRLVNELPGDCHGTYWIVEGGRMTPVRPTGTRRPGIMYGWMTFVMDRFYTVDCGRTK